MSQAAWRPGRAAAALAAAVLLHAAVPARAADVDGRPTVHVVYVTSSGCGLCRQEPFKDKLRAAIAAGREWAGEHDLGFVATGVAADLHLEVGWEFLRDSATFDQVIVGRWVQNEGFMAYVARHRGALGFRGDFPELAFPQLIVLLERRHVTGDRVVDTEPPVLLAREVGPLVTMVGASGMRELLGRRLSAMGAGGDGSGE